jgi:hypothetical protein
MTHRRIKCYVYMSGQLLKNLQKLRVDQALYASAPWLLFHKLWTNIDINFNLTKSVQCNVVLPVTLSDSYLLPAFRCLWPRLVISSPELCLKMGRITIDINLSLFFIHALSCTYNKLFYDQNNTTLFLNPSYIALYSRIQS